jgi:hypothetical protein
MDTDYFVKTAMLAMKNTEDDAMIKELTNQISAIYDKKNKRFTQHLECVMEMAKDDPPRKKQAWREAIKDGLYRNVENILNDCYDSLVKQSDNPRVAEILGPLGSMQWHTFIIRIIYHLKKNGSFEAFACHYSSNRIYDTFEDTAGGCDEMTYYAAEEVLDEMLKMS